MARHANRIQVHTAGGQRMRAVAGKHREGLDCQVHDGNALLIRDRQVVIAKALLTAPTVDLTGPYLSRADMEFNAETDAARHEWHPERRRDITLIGNLVDQAKTRLEEWPHHHDRRAVTVTAGRIWVPDASQATRRAREMAKECKRVNNYRVTRNYRMPALQGGWLTVADVKRIADAERIRAGATN